MTIAHMISCRLSNDSTFLTEAIANGYAPSRSWSFDYGEYKDSKDQPGELVIGGLNLHKSPLPELSKMLPINANISKICPFQVNVKGMKWGGHDLMQKQGTNQQQHPGIVFPLF